VILPPSVFPDLAYIAVIVTDEEKKFYNLFTRSDYSGPEGVLRQRHAHLRSEQPHRTVEVSRTWNGEVSAASFCRKVMASLIDIRE
jgi:hypothetical protein